jgi:hypothetical protein
MTTRLQSKFKITTLKKTIKTAVIHTLKDLSSVNIYLEKHLERAHLEKSNWLPIYLPMKKLPSKYLKKIESKIKRI